LGDWQRAVQLKTIGKDVFAVNLSTLTFVQAPSFQFKTLINDVVWQRGANEAIRLPLVIGPSGVLQYDLYPFFEAAVGVYDVLNGFQSRVLGNARSIVVYTPPSYNENAYKSNYPLLVMHDGQNVFNDSTSSFGVSWRAQTTLDSLIGRGDMIEVIVVGVYNTANRTNELTYSYDDSVHAGGDGDKYLDFIEDEVIPFAQAKYRASRDDVSLLGSSLGGLISCYAGWTRRTYKRVGCMSSSFWWNGQDFNKTVMTQQQSARTTLFYIDSGDSGNDSDGLAETLVVRDHFLRLGFNLNSNLYFNTDQGGQHNELSWGKRLWIPLQTFFAPQSASSRSWIAL